MTFSASFLKYLIAGIILLVISFYVVFFILKKIGKDPRNILPVNFAHRVRAPLVIFLISLLLKIAVIGKLFRFEYTASIVGHASTIGFIISIAWMLIILLKVFKSRVLRNYDVSTSDNLKARKIYTQFMLMENIIIFIIVILSLSIILMSFPGIRAIGVSLLTSAGIAGIIIGLAAQKAIGTILAGIQIAFTQPIRLEDVVIVEGEWGWIEEITLTYVVVRIWDKRRLIVPTTYFIDHTFQNWTRTSAEILGTVYIYTDYRVPVEKLREELTRLLESTALWDKKVNVLQVTNASEKTMEIRALMSASDSPTAWDLRVFIRENLIKFLQENHPEGLPRTRVSLEQEKSSEGIDF